MGLLKEFKEFAMRGNVVDLAIAVILGNAFSPIVKSMVDDILMPPLGKALGNVDFSNLFVNLSSDKPATSLQAAKAAGAATINYGLFLNYIINFIIIAFCLFLMVKVMNAMKKAPPPADPTTKECSRCCSVIPIRAKKCPMCTSDLPA